MHVTKAGIPHVVDWFHFSSCAHFLLFFAGGGANDSRFWKELLSKAATVDVISADVADVVLFNDDLEAMRKLPRPPFGKVPILSGIEILGADLPRPDHWDVVHFRQLKVNEHRESVERDSTSMTSELVKYYKLSADQLPAIIVETRFCEPLVVSTHDAASAQSLIEFLRELGKIKLPLFYAKPIEEPRDRSDQFAISQTTKNISKLCERIVQVANENQIQLPASFFNLSSAITDSIRGTGLAPEPGTYDRMLITRELAIFPALQALGARLDSAVFGLQQHQKKALRYQTDLAAVGRQMEPLDSVMMSLTKAQEALSALSNRFETQFLWNSRWRSLSDFARAALGIGKQMAELSDYRKKIADIASGPAGSKKVADDS